jgi:hypothetical protein
VRPLTSAHAALHVQENLCSYSPKKPNHLGTHQLLYNFSTPWILVCNWSTLRPLVLLLLSVNLLLFWYKYLLSPCSTVCPKCMSTPNSMVGCSWFFASAVLAPVPLDAYHRCMLQCRPCKSLASHLSHRVCFFSVFYCVQLKCLMIWKWGMGLWQLVEFGYVSIDLFLIIRTDSIFSW